MRPWEVRSPGSASPADSNNIRSAWGNGGSPLRSMLGEERSYKFDCACLLQSFEKAYHFPRDPFRFGLRKFALQLLDQIVQSSLPIAEFENSAARSMQTQRTLRNKQQRLWM